MLNGLKDRLSRLLTVRTQRQAWEGDPLTHPDIEAMDLRQIADLPMWAGRYRTDGTKRHGKPRDTAGSGTGRFSAVLPLTLTLLAGFAGTGSDAVAQSGERMAAFAMPADFGQWRPDTFVHNAYRFRQADGNCVVTFIQNRGADAARAAGREPRHSIDAYVEGVKARVERVERAEADAFELSSGPDEKVRFVAAEIAYVGQDHIEYHNRISAAWVDDVELVIVSACPASEWLAGRESIDALVNEVTITGFGKPAD